MELFNADWHCGVSNCKAIMKHRGKSFPYNLTSSGLAKMLMFGDYIKSRAAALSKTQKEVMEDELGNYPYMRKDRYVEPYFTPVDLSKKNTRFTAAVTG